MTKNISEHETWIIRKFLSHRKAYKDEMKKNNFKDERVFGTYLIADVENISMYLEPHYPGVEKLPMTEKLSFLVFLLNEYICKDGEFLLRETFSEEFKDEVNEKMAYIKRRKHFDPSPVLDMKRYKKESLSE